MNTFAPFYILSASLAGDSQQYATLKTETLGYQLAALGFVIAPVAGCYKGNKEPAVLAIPFAERLNVAERDVLRLARLHAQESVLAVDANGQAALIYCDDERRENLGQFQNVTEAEALKRDAYTQRGRQYYVTS